MHAVRCDQDGRGKRGGIAAEPCMIHVARWLVVPSGDA
jgi:hypothetical protein